MLSYLINLSVKNKFIVILLTVFVIGFGLYSLSQIPIGAVPNVTNNQVQVITTSRNLSTQDTEQFITYPVELEMANLPGVQEIRSISNFGLSVVTIVCDDDRGTFLPRQLIAEKIKSASEKIPEGFGTPEMGPVTSGLGEIYQYVLDAEPAYKDRYTTQDLRTIQDWIVKRQLSGIPGVVEVNTWGGFLKQYEVAISQGAYVAPETLIVEIVDNKSVHLELAVFEKDIMRVKKGQKLKFNVPEVLPDTLAGSVHLVGTSLESNRTVRVHGDIENENYIFLTGMFVEADIITETAMAFAVPSRAVVETDSNLYVLVLEKEKNGIYHFSQKEVVVDAQYNGYSALKNAQEFNPQTQFLIKGAFKLLGE